MATISWWWRISAIFGLKATNRNGKRREEETKEEKERKGKERILHSSNLNSISRFVLWHEVLFRMPLHLSL